MPISEVYNMDCIAGMKEYPDKYFDLAIVDPPYGIGEATAKIHSRHHSQKKYKVKDWDSLPPTQEYFDELQRVSKNQIVWGANHFISSNPKDSSCWIVWDKDTYGDFADCELAWTSFKTAVRKFKFTWNGFRQGYAHADKECRTHPTQKPVALYKWILKNYGIQGDKILDTHLGSGSSRIAAYDSGFDFVAFELDKEYYDAQEKRFQDHISQAQIFHTNEVIKPVQSQLF